MAKILHSLCCIIHFFLFSCAAFAEINTEKTALVIGNSAYSNGNELLNPTNDAEDIAAALKRMGFDVHLVQNTSKLQMLEAIENFAKRSQQSDLSIIYYAGHAVEVNSKNFLVPIDTKLGGDQSVFDNLVSSEFLLDALSKNSGSSILLLDACRDNPFGEQIMIEQPNKRVGAGLAREESNGTIVGLAASAGKFALDGGGRNSPFAAALLEFMEEPGLEVERLLRRVRDRVIEKTNGLQEPFTYGSLSEEGVYFSRPVTRIRPTVVQTSVIGSKKTLDFVLDFNVAQAINSELGYLHFLARHRKRKDNFATLEAKKLVEEFENQNAGRPLWLRPGIPTVEGEIKLSKNERRLIQDALGLLGVDIGQSDGIFGERTLRAVYVARKWLGLEPDVVVDAELVRRLPNPTTVDRLRSQKARRFRDVPLAQDLEARLARVLLILEDEPLVFGYLKGQLYVVVKRNREHDWAGIQKLAEDAGGKLASVETPAERLHIAQLASQDVRLSFIDNAGVWQGPVVGLQRKPIGFDPNIQKWKWVDDTEVSSEDNWHDGLLKGASGDRSFANLASSDGTRGYFWSNTLDDWRSFVIEIR